MIYIFENKSKKQRNPNPRAHWVLFDENSPFKPKKVKSKKQYQRQPKYRNNLDKE